MTDVTLADKIAAVVRAISDWDLCSADIRARDVPMLQAVLADLRERQAPTMRCDECDNGIERDWQFCSWCGEPIVELPVE